MSRRTVLHLAIGVVAGSLMAGSLTAWAADKYENRPFSGAITGTSAGEPGDESGEVVSISTGNLNATHVGNSTYVLATEQDYERHAEEEHPDQCAFVEDGEDGDGSPGLIITAANGDEIHGYVDDDRSVVCAPDEQGPMPMAGDVYHSTLYITVMGGTGRFADASGWLFSEGTSELTSINLLTGESTTTDEGTILGDIDY